MLSGLKQSSRHQERLVVFHPAFCRYPRPRATIEIRFTAESKHRNVREKGMSPSRASQTPWDSTPIEWPLKTNVPMILNKTNIVFLSMSKRRQWGERENADVMKRALTKLATQCIVLDIMTTVNASVGCLDAATEILGDKWTPQLLRYFVNEQTVRFCQLQDLAEGINPRTLSARLAYLEGKGIIVKNATHSSRCEYSLTSKGYDLLPILKDMQTWSDKHALQAV